MDVIFETQKGKPFSIEVGFFDTVLEIKEKIHKYHGISIPHQTLIFNGNVLQDDRDVEYCEILQNSRIQLLVSTDSDISNSTKQPQPNAAAADHQLPSPAKNVQLNSNTPSSKTVVPSETDVNDNPLRLKEKVHGQMDPVPVDSRSSRECELAENSDVDVNIKPSPTGSGTGSAGIAAGTPTAVKKLKLLVLPKCGTKKIAVEVNATDNVSELRKELQKLHQRLQFHLPQEGYFFIYKQNVMDDDRSFRWHQVGQGDTIEIFNGSVTGGS
ncbi:hypothetical protein E1A91_A10G016200v1 [Gossypium mustelinum]|uniref:Ubiquitin-like domain-containing protein n=1 Tax=Gossypium mustelinum TaxID=34275 RepID=A0A5D2XJ63_GOSMU|nr:hypothetical protein E1A91_A10G016200v1 [Gossypium mustelinum]